MYLSMWIFACVACAMAGYFTLCALSFKEAHVDSNGQPEQRSLPSAAGLFCIFLALAYFCLKMFSTSLLFN